MSQWLTKHWILKDTIPAEIQKAISQNMQQRIHSKMCKGSPFLFGSYASRREESVYFLTGHRILFTGLVQHTAFLAQWPHSLLHYYPKRDPLGKGKVSGTVYYICLGYLLLSSYVICREEAGMMLHRTRGSVHWSCYTQRSEHNDHTCCYSPLRTCHQHKLKIFFFKSNNKNKNNC